jgi:hypothetical protein
MLNQMIQAALLILLLWLLVNVVVVVVYRRELRRLWREPVFRHPVLVIESDDWGAGPLSQAPALRDIAEVLGRHRDASGRAPTLNLALVLAVPDGPAIQVDGVYRRICLDAPVFKPIVAALRQGRASGVFALQLHGMEHYWPPALIASDDAQVQAWLRQPVPATTESLPSPLQSRWVDTTRLPSTPHVEATIRAAVAEEAQTYTRVFGAPPAVVVPPTFVWTRTVEQAWAGQGVEIVVTPGWRYTGRNAQGQPDGDEGPIVNGDSHGGVTYLARTDYFEPSRGRDAPYALQALTRATAEGRVCLLENHRDNFINDAQQHQASLFELDKLYGSALKQYPDLRFLSSLELGAVLRARDPHWLMRGVGERLPYALQRLRHAGRLWKLLQLTGLALLGTLALSIKRRSPAG